MLVIECFVKVVIRVVVIDLGVCFGVYGIFF